MKRLRRLKTEVMLCGTAVRIPKSEEVRLFCRGERMLQSSCYKYLGNIVNPTATMSDDFDEKYKKALSRLKKLWKRRGSLSVDARIKVYEMVILPVPIYVFTLYLKLTDAQVSKLGRFERQVKDMKSRTDKTKSIENIIKK